MCWAVVYGVGEDACDFRCSGQRLSRGQSAWAEERNTGEIVCMVGLVEAKGESLIARMYGYSVKTLRRRTQNEAKRMGGNENRAACNAVCSCNLHRCREVAEDCDVANYREKG